jgi:hypothetical protein
MTGSHLLALALSAALFVSSLAVADDLPPATAPAFSAVYHLTSRARDKAQDDWTYNTEDTVTISVVTTKQSRWDYKSDGRTILIDQVSGSATVFGAKNLPPNTAHRSQAPFKPIGWEFGYDVVTKVNDNKPEILGKTTIAGKECTRLRLTSEQYGEPEYCVTNTGIVLRFANKSSTAEAIYEAQSLNESTPDPKLFSVPAGVTVEEKAGPKRPQIPRRPQ